jgi:rod shape-determining protein MreD
MTRERSPARQVLSFLAVAVALFLAVVVQVTVVNRLPLPGGCAPDLVLLGVSAVAVCTSPALAAITGFAGGLALDTAPPSAHYAGEYALVCCLVAWGAARAKAAIEHATGQWDKVMAFAVLAAAVIAGEAGKAGLGLLLSDPDVTPAAIRRVLPGSVAYDLVLAPLVLWLVLRIARPPAAGRGPAPVFSSAQRLAPAFRPAAAGAAPDLRLAGTGQKFVSAPQWPASGARRVPKLHPSGARSSRSSITGAAYSPGAPLSPGARPPLAGGRAPRLNFAVGAPQRKWNARAGTAAGRLRTPGKNWLRNATKSAAFPARPSGYLSRSPRKGWLSPVPAPSGNGRRAALRTAPDGKRHHRIGRRPERYLPGGRPPVPPGARPMAKGAIVSGARRSGPVLKRTAPDGRRRRPTMAGAIVWGARRSGPVFKKGSRPVPRRRRAPGRNWLRGSRRPAGMPYGNWYGSAPSGAWLRRSHSPWRKAKGAIVSGARSGALRRKGWRW